LTLASQVTLLINTKRLVAAREGEDTHRKKGLERTAESAAAALTSKAEAEVEAKSSRRPL
jgi:hypothetical protein